MNFVFFVSPFVGGKHRLKRGLKRDLKGGLKGGCKVGLKGAPCQVPKSKQS